VRRVGVVPAQDPEDFECVYRCACGKIPAKGHWQMCGKYFCETEDEARIEEERKAEERKEELRKTSSIWASSVQAWKETEVERIRNQRATERNAIRNETKAYAIQRIEELHCGPFPKSREEYHAALGQIIDTVMDRVNPAPQ
jgi:hypothetical protein